MRAVRVSCYTGFKIIFSLSLGYSDSGPRHSDWGAGHQWTGVAEGAGGGHHGQHPALLAIPHTPELSARE